MMGEWSGLSRDVTADAVFSLGEANTVLSGVLVWVNLDTSWSHESCSLVSRLCSENRGLES